MFYFSGMSRAINIVKRVREICDENGYRDPIEFLVHAQAGVDPRDDLSLLYQLVVEAIQGKEPGELPEPDQWVMIRDLVLSDPVYAKNHIVHSASLKAATELLKYLAPGLKAIEIKTDDGEARKAILEPLTADEIESFEEKFCRDY